MTKEDLNKKTDKELKKILASKREDLREVRFGLSGSKSRDTSVSKKLRKEIASLMTELNSRA